jgi:hypothetical protein
MEGAMTTFVKKGKWYAVQEHDYGYYPVFEDFRGDIN